MNKLSFILILLCVLNISGCYYGGKDSGQSGIDTYSQTEVKEISINGIDKIQEISSDIPVKLDINGIGHQITIKKGTVVNSIDVNGQNITIRLPEGANPEINDNGIDIQIIYY
jgi:hypothetical protein